MKFLRHLAQAFGVSLLCAAMSIVWLQTLLFNTAPAHAAGGSPRHGEFGPSLEQCGKSKVQAEKIEYCSFVISRSSDRKILERAFDRRGLAYMDLQRFAEAAKDFTEVIKINPRIAGYFDNRQNAYKAMGRLSDALNDANKAIELAPTYAFVFRARADVYVHMGRYDLALRDYNRAITLEPKDASLVVDRGKVYVKAQQIDKAVADFTEAFDSDRNMTVALRERGFAYRLLGNFDAARADLTLFLRLQPNDEEVVSALRDIAPQPVRLAVTKSDESSPLHVPSGSVLGQSEAQRVSERRVALVVGNSAYRNVSSLTNPANDAVLIAKTLSSLGFELVGGSAQIDLDKPGFEAAVKRFGTLLQGAEVGLFYYAGHGVQVRGENYLVPVSANPAREADVDLEMLGTSLVLHQMEGAQTRLNLVLLDACRNNPFGARGFRAMSRGLAQMDAPKGTLISFATAPGDVASDGEDGHSPYTKALAETMRQPGLDLFKVFNDVGVEVAKQTAGSQQPWWSSSPINGSFYFSGAPAAQPIPIAVAPAPAPAPAQQPNEAQQIWGTIQNTTSIAVLEKFILQFPGSFYADIARARLGELKKSQTPASSPPMSVSTLEQLPEPVYQNDTPKVTRYPDKDAPGNDAKWMRDIGSVEACEKLCLSESACAGYTYNIKQSACFLKTAIGSLLAARDSTVTGVVNRQSAYRASVNDGGVGTPKVTRYPNMDAPGNDAPWVQGIATVDQCEHLCLGNSACAGYTYNIKHSTCIPKTVIGPLSPASDPAITGIVEPQGRGFLPQAPSMADARPSFNCFKARAPGERAICASQTLSRLDGELANRYRAWLDSHSGAAASVSQRHQKEFLAARKKCRANTSCLEEIYRSRLGDFPGQSQSWQLEQGRSAADQSALPATQNRVITIAGKPSFDCHKAKSDTSQTICGSPQLINLDLQLANLFWAKMAKLKGTGAEEEKRRQYDWGVARNQCGADAACIEQSYLRRIAEFEGHTYLPPVQQPPEQKPQHAAEQKPPPAPEQKPQDETPARPKGPIATVQQLPNPIHLIGQADQPCDVASATLARLRKTLSVSVPDGLMVQAESLRSFTWTTSGAPPLGPAYLVLATHTPVRVRGTGFYALTPEAKAPFRIKQFLKDTRVIIPLHVKGAPQNGEIKIRPLIAGPLRVSAAIIGYTQCGENPDPAPIAFDLTVEPGTPEIVIADRFDLAKPDQIIASPNGTRRLEIYGPRYHLIDVPTGTLLADEVGKEPRFSPTGRFVVAVTERHFVFRDSIDGKVAHKHGPRPVDTPGPDYTAADEPSSQYTLVWDDGDSFISFAGTVGEAVYLSYIWNGLEDEEAEGIDCPCSDDTFYSGSSFKLDLENNVAVGSDYKERGEASSLTVRSVGEVKLSVVYEDLQASAAVLPLTVPKSWETVDGLKITHAANTEIVRRFLTRPIILASSNGHRPLINNDPLPIASRGLGNGNLTETEVASRRDQRLRDFGIEINPYMLSLKLDRSILLKNIDGAQGNFQLRKDNKIRLANTDSGACDDLKPTASGGTDVSISGEDRLTVGQIQAEGFRLTILSAPCTPGDEDYNIYPYLHDSRRPGQLLNLAKLLDPENLFLGSYCDDGMCSFATADLLFNRYLIVWIQGKNAAAIFDIEERKLISVLDGLPSPDVAQHMSLSKDLQTLVKLDKDGGFQVIALRPAQKDAEGHLTKDSTKVDVLLFGRIVDDEVVVWTSSGQFDSTAEGASHVAVRFPGRSGEYTLDQFHKLFHQNDLLKRALAGEEFKPPVVRNFPPSITVKPAFTADTIAAKIEVLGDDPVDEIRVYQDGLMTNVVPVAGDAKTVDVNAKRLPGSRWIAFLARGPSGLYSQPSAFDAGLFPGARRRVYIVSVGIDHYEDDRIQQLHFAGSDAARFLKSLQDKAGTSVEIVSNSLLRDAEASREAILAKLNDTIAKAEPGDSILLFIAGHGVQAADKNYYLATSVTRVDDIEHTSLRWSDLSNALAKARSRIAVFLDTCQSGAAGTDFFATNDASVSALIDRAPSGILIFSASKGRELSEESADHGGGIFTSAVIGALSDPKTDHNHNGVIEASELYASVKRTVVEATEGRQTPWFARNDMVGDFVPF